jgi:hypothetical protein
MEVESKGFVRVKDEDFGSWLKRTASFPSYMQMLRKAFSRGVDIHSLPSFDEYRRGSDAGDNSKRRNSREFRAGRAC